MITIILVALVVGAALGLGSVISGASYSVSVLVGISGTTFVALVLSIMSLGHVSELPRQKFSDDPADDDDDEVPAGITTTVPGSSYTAYDENEILQHVNRMSTMQKLHNIGTGQWYPSADIGNKQPDSDQ